MGGKEGEREGGGGRLWGYHAIVGGQGEENLGFRDPNLDREGQDQVMGVD